METNKTTLEKITGQIVKVFANPGMLAVYNGANEQYTVLCGWTGGINSPESRPAYVKTFGAVMVAEAEGKARCKLDELREEYERGQWGTMARIANSHAANGLPIPSQGLYCWAVGSGLKNCGSGHHGEIEAQAVDCDTVPPPALLHVMRVITTSAEEFDRPQLADELAADGLPGGGWYEDNELLQLVSPYHLACIEVAAVTDGKRYYYIDSEGYDYARYIYLPLTWREMFSAELMEATAKEQARKAKEQAEEEAAHTAAVAEYRAKCDRWARYMKPIAELEAAERAAKYGTPEYKAAARALAAARRANILAMCRAAFPGVKFSVKQCKGWGKSWELAYTDGPTVEAFTSVVDLDLFQTYCDTFDGMTDCSDTVRIDEVFCEFAHTYMGRRGTGGVKVERNMSEAAAATLRAKVIEAVPALANGESIHRDRLSDAQRTAVYDLVGLDWSCIWYHADSLAREIFANTDYYTTPERATTAKATTSATSPTEQDAAPYEGLQLVEIADGVAVIGDSRTTYRSRKAIKAHGATWNRAAQQWQATAPEAVQRLRSWFGVESLEEEKELETA